MFWSQVTAQLNQLENALLLFRGTLTAVGIGLIMVGAMMYFYRPKEEAKRPTPTARWSALILFSLLGIGTILYAWIWFGSK